MKATVAYLPPVTPLTSLTTHAPHTPLRQLCINVPATETSANVANNGVRRSSCCCHCMHRSYARHAASAIATTLAPPSTAVKISPSRQEEKCRFLRSGSVRERRRNVHICFIQSATATLPATATASASESAFSSVSPLSVAETKDADVEVDDAANVAMRTTAELTAVKRTEGAMLSTWPTVSVPLLVDRVCDYDYDRILKTNSRLADSIKLSNTQLVMPIGNSSRLGNDTVAENEVLLLSPILARATHFSQTTTTLECRCFKESGDILSEQENKEEELRIKKQNKYANEKVQTTVNTNMKEEVRTYLGAQWRLSISTGPLAPPPKLLKMLVVSKWLLMLLMVMSMSISTADCWTGRQDVPTNCTFPARWEGSWFLSGYQQSIHIKGSQFSYRGKCAASDGNKYLIVDEKGCHRCLVIYEKHKNVLQYKESECEGDSIYMHQSNPSAMAMRSVLKQSDHRGGAHPNSNGHSRLSSSDQYIMRSNDDMNDCPPDFCKGRETLQNLCDQIPGDALLYSLFRENAEPVKCPLKGPFIFTYNRGHGECKNPVSNIESCTEDSRLLLSFQACHDVQGTESTVEELTCLATWKDGNSRYLVGLVSHHHAISNEERYRCFVYEKINSLMGGPSLISSKDAEYKLAQSGDATCNGLDSAEVGSRIMSLRKPPVTERCDFPVWFKGPRHWHALMGNAVYNYHSNDGSVHIIKSNGYMETRALCEQINKQTSTEMMAVVHYTTGCQSGFMCMMFYRRDTHVIEIQTGKQASRLEDACAPDHFDISRMPYITLLASNPDPQICPMEGLYNLRGAIGPPYLTTRHKRNHNNKSHNMHTHHHQQAEGAVGNGGGHKRHTTLSFRSAEHYERGSWPANTRGLPVRSRRAAAVTSTSSPNAVKVFDNETSTAPSASATAETPLTATSNETSVALVPVSERQRNRRDVPGCITNYKAQRQLWVGCTEPNVIDVRPLCNDDGDEEYSCHGSWSENGTVYIIARHKGTKHGVCVSYRPTEGTAAKLVVGDACYRGVEKPPEHHLVANLSIFGKCGETGSASTQIHVIDSLAIVAVALLTTLLSQLRISSDARGLSLSSR